MPGTQFCSTNDPLLIQFPCPLGNALLPGQVDQDLKRKDQAIFNSNQSESWNTKLA